MRMVPATASNATLREICSGIVSLFAGEGKAREFARALGSFTGAKFCFPISSGHAAFWVILKALSSGSPEKDEVVVPSYTCPSVFAAVLAAGLKPVLCDIERDTLSMDPGDMEKRMGERTLCVVPVHMFGYPCRMDAIAGMARREGVYTVEDVANGLGGEYGGKKLGTAGDAGFYSFGEAKNINTGGGGAIVTGSDELASKFKTVIEGLRPLKFTEAASCLRHLAMYSIFIRPRPFFVANAVLGLMERNKPKKEMNLSMYWDGVTARYSEAQAAIGLMALGRLDSLARTRMENGIALSERLRSVENLVVVEPPDGAVSLYLRLPVIFESPEARNNARRDLLKAGIRAGVAFEDDVNAVYGKWDIQREKSCFENGRSISRRLLTLPTHHFVTGKDIDTISAVLKKGDRLLF